MTQAVGSTLSDRLGALNAKAETLLTDVFDMAARWATSEGNSFDEADVKKARFVASELINLFSSVRKDWVNHDGLSLPPLTYSAMNRVTNTLLK